MGAVRMWRLVTVMVVLVGVGVEHWGVAGDQPGPRHHVSIPVRGYESRMTQKCKTAVADLIVNCFLELKYISENLGFSFPPRLSDEKPVISDEALARFDQAVYKPSDSCCSSLCSLTEERCLCDERCYSALGRVFMDGPTHNMVYKKLTDTCGILPISFGIHSSCNGRPTECSKVPWGSGRSEILNAPGASTEG